MSPTLTMIATARTVASGEPIGGLPVTGGIAPARRLTLAAVALLLAAAVGGLRFGDALYQVDPIVRPGLYGQDGITLLAAVPLLLAAMWAAHRGSARGLVLWAGMLLYFAYGYYFYLAGVPFGPLFLVHAASLSACLYAFVALLGQVDAEAMRSRFALRLDVRPMAAFLAVAGVAFGLLWTIDVVRRLLAGEPLDALARTVYAIDLAVVLPAMIAVGVGLWHRRAWAYAPAGALLVMVSAYMITLLLGSALVASGGRAVLTGQAIAFAATGALAVACCTVFLRGLRR